MEIIPPSTEHSLLPLYRERRRVKGEPARARGVQLQTYDLQPDVSAALWTLPGPAARRWGAHPLLGIEVPEARPLQAFRALLPRENHKSQGAKRGRVTWEGRRARLNSLRRPFCRRSRSAASSLASSHPLLPPLPPPPPSPLPASSRLPPPIQPLPNPGAKRLLISVFSPLPPPDTVIRAGPAGILSPHRPHISIACPLSRTSNLSVRAGRPTAPPVPPRPLRASRPVGHRCPPSPGPLAGPPPQKAPGRPPRTPSGALSRCPEDGDRAPGDPLSEGGPRSPGRGPCAAPCPLLDPPAARFCSLPPLRPCSAPRLALLIAGGDAGSGWGIGVHQRSGWFVAALGRIQ